MNLSDLRIFVHAARSPSLGATAQEMHLTPSAVSKALRRLEENLGMPLFDRSAKQLVLNESGTFLLARAQTLLALADQARSDLLGGRAAIECRLAGPAVLLWRHGQAVSAALREWPEASLRMQAMFEDEALAALARGDASAALVTHEAIEGRGEHWSEEWQVTELGSVTQHLVAGASHPLRKCWPTILPAPHAPCSAAFSAAAARMAGATTSCHARSATGPTTSSCN
jgi:DNA-binding transcriptional LysR family regulator